MSGRNSTGNKFATVRHAPNHVGTTTSVGVRGHLTNKQQTGRLQVKTERLQTSHRQRNNNVAVVVKRDKNCQSQSKATNKTTNNGRIALQH